MSRFVVHEHRAPRLHWDLRLEHGGVLVSWAVPKGVPLEPGTNRLAIAVGDHDLEHLTYTDDDKSIWDTGTYTAHEFADAKVVVTFDGERLHGSYALIRTSSPQWLLRRIPDRTGSGSVPRMTALTDDATGTFAIGGELPVRRLGFGAMRLTGTGIWGQPADLDNARAVARHAVELGVTLIDTADSYGPEVSENLLAEALHPYPDELVIATKGGFLRDGPNQWRPNGRPDHLRQACEGSLRRLRVDQIDLYQLHTVDRAVPIEESVGTLDDLQTEGKIRHVGVSNVSVEQLERAQAVTRVVSVQNRYNLTDRASEDVLAACETEGLAFLPWYPLATGKLSEPGGPLDAIAAAHHATPGQVALAWLLQRSPVMLPIPGTSSIAHLEENLGAAGVRLDPDEFAELDRSE